MTNTAPEEMTVSDTAEVEIAEPTLDQAVELPLASVVEAVLFAARRALTLAQIGKCAAKGTRQNAVREAVNQLNEFYQESGRAFEIVEVAGKFQLMSRPEYAPYLRELFGSQNQDRERKLTPAMLDTLSIIAYKQPITRVEVETIRGVSCGPILRALIERGSVRVVGKNTEVLGHPLLYGTAETFLQEFGLPALEALPMIREMRRATGADASLPQPEADAAPVGKDNAAETESIEGEDDPEAGEEFEEEEADGGQGDEEYQAGEGDEGEGEPKE